MILQAESFGTPDSKLAACLAALRIPVWQIQPADKVRDIATGRQTVTWFFEPNNGTDSCRMVEKWWRNRAEFEASNPQHPLIPMRRALESKEWINKILNDPNIHIEPPRGDYEKFRTKDSILAACLRALGHPLLDFGKKPDWFDFPKAAEREDFRHYENFHGRQSPIAWMRLALECRQALLDVLRDPRCKWREKRVLGDPLNGGKICYIVEGTPEWQADMLLEKFYGETQ